MSARKLGGLVAGLFVAFGLAFGGSIFASAGGDDAAVAAATPATVAITQIDFEWG